MTTASKYPKDCRFPVGTRIRSLYEYSDTGKIVRPRVGNGLPTPDWRIVQFDDDGDHKGGRLCVHIDMLAESNSITAER